jgi:hypothetical protein
MGDKVAVKSSENHAREIKFMAARRIGELVPEKERGGKPDRGSNSQISAIEIPHQRLSEFRKLADDLSGKVENLLFVIWIQDQRHDYWMKFIEEVRTALEILREEIKEDERLFHSVGTGRSLPGESKDNISEIVG